MNLEVTLNTYLNWVAINFCDQVSKVINNDLRKECFLSCQRAVLAQEVTR